MTGRFRPALVKAFMILLCSETTATPLKNESESAYSRSKALRNGTQPSALVIRLRRRPETARSAPASLYSCSALITRLLSVTPLRLMTLDRRSRPCLFSPSMFVVNSLNTSKMSVERPRFAVAASMAVLPRMFRTWLSGFGTMVIFCERPRIWVRIDSTSSMPVTPIRMGAVKA